MTKSRQIAYLAALLNALIWGAAMPLVKPSLDIITPHQFLFLRYILAAACTLPLLIWAIAKHHLPLKKLPLIIGIELLSLTALLLIYVGLQKTAALQASFILNTTPIFATIAGIMFLKEREEKNEWFGMGLAVAGTTMLLASPLLQGENLAHFSPIGNLIILAAVLMDVFRLSLMKKVYGHIHKVALIAVSSLVGFFYFGAITLFTASMPSPEQVVAPSVILAVLYMGTIGTLLAFTFQFIAYTLIEVSEAALFTYLQPLVYIPLSVFWLKDTILPIQLVGLLLIAVGVFVAEKRSQIKKRLSLTTTSRPE